MAFKRIKTNVPKQFITDLLYVVLKKYSVLSVELHNRISSVIILSSFRKKNTANLIIPSMDILGGNVAHPPLYLYMYQMCFSLGSFYVFFLHHLNFAMALSMLSVVHK